MLQCELVTSKQLLSHWKQKMLQGFLIDSSSDICSQKTQAQLQLLTFYPRPWCFVEIQCWSSCSRACQLHKASSKLVVVSFLKRNGELQLIIRDNCPVPLLRGKSQLFLALLKIQKGLHSWYAVGVAHFLYSAISC